jgi:hypothetical protein
MLQECPCHEFSKELLGRVVSLPASDAFHKPQRFGAGVYGPAGRLTLMNIARVNPGSRALVVRFSEQVSNELLPEAYCRAVRSAERPGCNWLEMQT